MYDVIVSNRLSKELISVNDKFYILEIYLI